MNKIPYIKTSEWGWIHLKRFIIKTLQKINESDNFDVLNKELYDIVINKGKVAFGECRYDYIELYKVSSFLQQNNLDINRINKIVNEYQLLRNKPGNYGLKIIGDMKNKPTPEIYKYLNTKDKKIYDNYYHLNNIYYNEFFKTRDEKTKNIKIGYDKTEYNYLDVHHNCEIECIKNDKGEIIPNLSDLNIVLNEDYHHYQKRKHLLRADLFVHSFLHLIDVYVNKYASHLNLFKAIKNVLEEKEKFYNTNKLITKDEFYKSDIGNNFTDYTEFIYMFNKYNRYEIKLFSAVIDKVLNKLKETQRINNEK